jgi:MFS family permease
MELRPDGDPPGKNGAPEDGREQEGESSPYPEYTLKQALSSSVFWLLSGAFFCQSLTHSVVFVHSVPHLTDIGISMEKAAFSIGLLTLVSVAGRLGFGYMGDFVDKRFLFAVSYILMGTGVFVLEYAQTMPLVYLYIALFGVGFGGTVPLSPSLQAEYFGRKAFGKIQGATTPLVMIAGTTGPLMAGYLFDKTGAYHVSFFIASVIPFLAALMAVCITPLKIFRGKRLAFQEVA